MLITAWGNAGLIFTVGPPSSCGVSFVIACRTVSLWRWLCAISNSGLQVCHFQQCQCLSFTGLPPSVAFVMCVLLLLFAGGVEVSSPFQNRQLPIFCHPPFWFLPGTGPDQTTQGDQESSVCVCVRVWPCVWLLGGCHPKWNVPAACWAIVVFVAKLLGVRRSVTNGAWLSFFSL